MSSITILVTVRRDALALANNFAFSFLPSRRSKRSERSTVFAGFAFLGFVAFDFDLAGFLAFFGFVAFFGFDFLAAGADSSGSTVFNSDMCAPFMWTFKSARVILYKFAHVNPEPYPMRRYSVKIGDIDITSDKPISEEDLKTLTDGLALRLPHYTRYIMQGRRKGQEFEIVFTLR
jgi:hypothetical protein